MKLIIDASKPQHYNWAAFGLDNTKQYRARVKSVHEDIGDNLYAYSLRNSGGFFHDISKIHCNDPERNKITFSDYDNFENVDIIFDMNSNVFIDSNLYIDVFDAINLTLLNIDMSANTLLIEIDIEEV